VHDVGIWLSGKCVCEWCGSKCVCEWCGSFRVFQYSVNRHCWCTALAHGCFVSWCVCVCARVHVHVGVGVGLGLGAGVGRWVRRWVGG